MVEASSCDMRCYGQPSHAYLAAKLLYSTVAVPPIQDGLLVNRLCHVVHITRELLRAVIQHHLCACVHVKCSCKIGPWR